MAIQLMLGSVLRRYVPGYRGETGELVDAARGATVRDLAGMLRIPEKEVKLIIVDGIIADWETPLEGAKRVALFPPVGGG